jgi:hypothetical protein
MVTLLFQIVSLVDSGKNLLQLKEKVHMSKARRKQKAKPEPSYRCKGYIRPYTSNPSATPLSIRASSLASSSIEART